MRDLIRPDASFTPRELFARMQGAWFEPRQGSMWQENTGVTPTTSGGQTIGKLADLSGRGYDATQSTAANRPTYQLNGTLPLIRHDGTDFLTATLPSINVRRNLLPYSEQFDSAAWNNTPFNALTNIPNAVIGPFGRPASLWKTTTAPNREHFAYGPIIGSMTSGQVYTVSAIVKAAGYNWFRLAFPADKTPANERAAWFNLATGEKGTVQPNVTANVISLGEGWYVCSISRAMTNTASGASFFPLIANADNVVQFTADGSSGIYFAGFQIELGSTATDYQKITDWTSEAYSSSGSTYFATPQGMSALHNQSIGTSYNLPAPQTDIYGTVITPARLAPPLEQRLALYMHRLAGLSDADFFWQEQATDGMTGQLLADDNDTILLRA